MADEKSHSAVGKIVATVFGAVVAPILVAVGIKWLSPGGAGGPTNPPPPSQQTPTTPPKAPPPPPPEITPKLSDHFYSYGWSEKTKGDVKNDDVDPAFFQYVATPPSINAIAALKPALLETKHEYDNYSLHVDFKWGENTVGERATKNLKRLGEIMVHGTGPDGDLGIFPQCVGVKLDEGGTGSIVLRGASGKIRCNAKVTENAVKLRRDFVGGNSPVLPQVSKDPEGWNGVILRLGYPTDLKEIKDEKGWHPKGDPTKPGVVNKVQIDSHNGTLRVYVNGKLVNEVTGLTQRRGRIGFFSYQAEYSISRIAMEQPRQ